LYQPIELTTELKVLLKLALIVSFDDPPKNYNISNDVVVLFYSSLFNDIKTVVEQSTRQMYLDYNWRHFHEANM